MDLTTERVLKELAAIAFFDPRSLLGPGGLPLDLKDLPDGAAAAVRSYSVSYGESRDSDGVFDRVRTVEVHPCDKLRALQTLLRHLADAPAVEELSAEEAASLLNLDDARKQLG